MTDNTIIHSVIVVVMDKNNQHHDCILTTNINDLNSKHFTAYRDTAKAPTGWPPEPEEL